MDLCIDITLLDLSTASDCYSWAWLIGDLNLGLKTPGVRRAAVILFVAGLHWGAITQFFTCLLTRYSSTASTLLYVPLGEGITISQYINNHCYMLIYYIVRYTNRYQACVLGKIKLIETTIRKRRLHWTHLCGRSTYAHVHYNCQTSQMCQPVWSQFLIPILITHPHAFNCHAGLTLNYPFSSIYPLLHTWLPSLVYLCVNNDL